MNGHPDCMPPGPWPETCGKRRRPGNIDGAGPFHCCMRPLLLLLLLPGCIAAHGRAHVGPSIDSDGRLGFYGGVMVGGGYATSSDSGYLGTIGFATGRDSRVLLSGAAEYARLPDDGEDFGWRAGMANHVPLLGEHGLFGLQGALLHPVRTRRSSGGHEKSFRTTDHSAWLVGFETLIGGAYQIVRGEDPHTELRAGARLAFTVEWLGFSTVR